MDLVHDKASIIAEEDRISNLPDDIILHILSFLDMKYAIQTCTLSKKWKNIWTSLSNLNLNSRMFRTLPKFTDFVKHALSHRNCRTEVSAVNITFTGRATEFVVNNILNYAYSHNAKQLTMIWFNHSFYVFPKYVFSSHTLKHLTLNDHCRKSQIPKSPWDFPALETLNLSNMCLGDRGDKSLNLFSNCVNLKDLTLHRVYMFGLEIFNIYAPQLSNLTITDAFAFPRVFNVVAPQLKNLTASVRATIDEIFRSFHFLQLSTKGFDSLEKVNLSLVNSGNKKEIYVPVLLSLFWKLRSAKFLIVNGEITQALSSCLDRFSHVPCPFNNLKYLKINMVPLKKNDSIPTIPNQVRNYLLENSPNATFIMDLPQAPRKRSWQQVDNSIMAKKVDNIESEKKQPENMLGAKMFKQDEVIAKIQM